MTDVIRVGMLGCGTVGAAVVRLLAEHAEEIELRVGCRIQVTRVAVRDAGRERDVPLAPQVFTQDPMEVVSDPDVDVVCELMGGIDFALELSLAAIDRGVPLVTANKELVATHGRELFDAAGNKGLDLFFEAAVGGGIPIIRPLKESLAGERVQRIIGIVNGTTNYILTRMSEEKMSFDDVLEQAQRLGFAEADPTADVEGFDAAAKIAILASIAFNSRVVTGDVAREGITGVRAQDIDVARRLGYVVKLLAIAELAGGAIAVRVHPAMIPATHPLASVRDSFNAVFVEGEKVGELMFYGRGAGGDPTATAVVGDLITAARDLQTGGRGIGCACSLDRSIIDAEDIEDQYYLLFRVEDRPGVLAEIAAVFGQHGVSIRNVWQEGSADEAQLVFVTHRARGGAIADTTRQLSDLSAVREIQSVLRVEGEE